MGGAAMSSTSSMAAAIHQGGVGAAALASRCKTLDRYLEPLADVQEQLGELDDLFVARVHDEQALVRHRQGWFALGWLTARIADAALRHGAGFATTGLARSARRPSGRLAGTRLLVFDPVPSAGPRMN